MDGRGEQRIATSLFEHSLGQDEDVQGFVAAQGLPLPPSPENLYARLGPSRLTRCLPRARCTSLAFSSSLSLSLSFSFLRFPLRPPSRRADPWRPDFGEKETDGVSDREDEQGRGRVHSREGDRRDRRRASERDPTESQRAEIIGCACALINLYTPPGREYHQSSSFLPAICVGTPW